MGKFLRYLFWVSLLVAALVGLLRLTAIRWWQIPVGDPYLEASIAPTLRGGDWVILWRATSPHAGDLAVCPDPKAPTRQVIARFGGMQGDHVTLSRRSLTVNGKVADNTGSCDTFKVIDPVSGLEVAQGCSEEELFEKTHMTAMVRDGYTQPADADLDVPAGQVFLASDNRQFPWDSRDFGTVDRSSCTESVVFRLVSKDGFFDVPNRLSLIH
jgi:signal peptidase I